MADGGHPLDAGAPDRDAAVDVVPWHCPRPARDPHARLCSVPASPECTLGGCLSFCPGGDFPTGNGPVAAVAADFNLDGKMDFATLAARSHEVLVHLATDAGFLGPLTVDTHPYPWALAAGDVDQDGLPDLLVATGSSTDTQVFQAQRDGGPRHKQPPFLPVQALPGGGRPMLVDLDGDGMTDLASTGGDDVAIYLAHGRQGLALACSRPSHGTAWDSVVGDFDGDGRADLLQLEGPGLSFLKNLGGGRVARPRPVHFIPGQGGRLAAADFNGDGVLDVAVARPDNTIRVLLGNGDATFRPTTPSPLHGTPGNLAAHDFNRDGLPDLVFTTLDVDGVSILLSVGDGTFHPEQRISDQPSAYALAVADFNGDGQLDVVTVSLEGVHGYGFNPDHDRVTILWNTSGCSPSDGGRTGPWDAGKVDAAGWCLGEHDCAVDEHCSGAVVGRCWPSGSQFGRPCASSLECSAPWSPDCVEGADGGFCSRSCPNTDSCPTGFGCLPDVGVQTGHGCLPYDEDADCPP